MKYIALLFLALAFSCQQPKKTTPSDYLSPVEQESFKYSIVRYTNGLPKRATDETKFDNGFDAEYRDMATRNNLLYYYKADDSTVYFAVTRIAPSLKIKRVATVGKLKYGKDKEITEYEEGFRTWKMEEKELEEKTAMLFDKYINGEDLSEYYTKNSGGKFIIEFPDDNVKYNKENRRWE